jgi:hypothetical protein
MTKQELLQKTLIFLTEDKWTVNFLAVDSERSPVLASSIFACAWCFQGALLKLGDKKLLMDISLDFLDKYQKNIADSNDFDGYEKTRERLQHLYD